jgi:hypothetical protein
MKFSLRHVNLTRRVVLIPLAANSLRGPQFSCVQIFLKRYLFRHATPTGGSLLPPGSTISSGHFLWLSASPCSSFLSLCRFFRPLTGFTTASSSVTLEAPLRTASFLYRAQSLSLLGGSFTFRDGHPTWPSSFREWLSFLFVCLPFLPVFFLTRTPSWRSSLPAFPLSVASSFSYNSVPNMQFSLQSNNHFNRSNATTSDTSCHVFTVVTK